MIIVNIFTLLIDCLNHLQIPVHENHFLKNYLNYTMLCYHRQLIFFYKVISVQTKNRNEWITVHPHSHRHVWTLREEAILKRNIFNEKQSPVHNSHRVKACCQFMQCTLLTHQNCALNAERSHSTALAIRTDI